MYILSGRGAGQFRRVIAFENRSWEISAPFDIDLDTTTSYVVIGAVLDHILACFRVYFWSHSRSVESSRSIQGEVLLDGKPRHRQ